MIPSVEVPPGHIAVLAPLDGIVLSVAVAAGDQVAPGDELLVIESMKMEHPVQAEAAGQVQSVLMAVGVTVAAGTVLLVLAPSGEDAASMTAAPDVALDHIRADLAEARERHRIGLDEARAEATGRRHAAGRRTARENIADLVDPGSFVEYGALAIAAQRRRRSLDDLIARTPADGLVMGTATVDGQAGRGDVLRLHRAGRHPGLQNHRKTDRLLELAERARLPVVMFAEGGGGRPGRHRHRRGRRAGRADLPAARRAVRARCRWSRSCPGTASPATPRWPGPAT